MHNELLHIGPLTVYGYGFMIAMGVLAAWFVAEQRARKLKLACEHIFYLVVWCAIGGFTSAKILFWITNWREFLQNPRQIIGSRWICGIWRNHRRNSGGLAVLQDKEVEISGVF